MPYQGRLLDLECPVHGINPYTWEAVSKRYRCRGCNTAAILKRKLKLKRKLIEERGSGCERCTYDKCLGALHFHHLDRSTKNFSLSRLASKSEALVRVEVVKCVLLCANCHAEVEEELRGPVV